MFKECKEKRMSDVLILQGRAVNTGTVQGEAFVLDVPFSFIGDFDVDSGVLTINGHPLFGKSIASKVLVCPTGKGGTIAPFIAFRAQQQGTAPSAILCQKADPVLCECAFTINIPLLDTFEQNPVDVITNGVRLAIEGNTVTLKQDSH
jgi:predicted aconitase with swiveling domain